MVISLCSFASDYHGRGILPSSTGWAGGPSEHKWVLSDVQMLITISTSGPGLPMADGQKPIPVSVQPFRWASAESCIRKAVAERGLTPASAALRMQRRRTKPLRGGPTAPSPMGIEWPDSRPVDAPEGPFGQTQGLSRGCVDVVMLSAGAATRGVPILPPEGGR